MVSAFASRRPWAAALIGLLLGPFVGMLYLGRGALAGAYVVAFGAVYGLPLCLAHFGLLPFEAETAIIMLVAAYRLGGAFHCERVARKAIGVVPTAWFARWYTVVLVGLVLPIGVRMVVWEPFNMPSASMEPTLNVGDYFVVEKALYGLGEPQRGDLVVFHHPADEAPYVKRLVGLPGDSLQWQSGILLLNGVPLPREAVTPQREGERGMVYRETPMAGRSYLIWEVSDEHRFDNTEVYEVPEDHYFVAGDNRDNSLDSRHDIGYVPRESLVGRVGLIVWNSKAQKLRFAVPE